MYGKDALPVAVGVPPPPRRPPRPEVLIVPQTTPAGRYTSSDMKIAVLEAQLATMGSINQNINVNGGGAIFKEPPGYCLTCFCPALAIFIHEGCTCNLCIECLICPWYYANCCWTPKLIRVGSPAQEEIVR